MAVSTMAGTLARVKARSLLNRARCWLAGADRGELDARCDVVDVWLNMGRDMVPVHNMLRSKKLRSGGLQGLHTRHKRCSTTRVQHVHRNDTSS